MHKINNHIKDLEEKVKIMQQDHIDSLKRVNDALMAAMEVLKNLHDRLSLLEGNVDG